MQTKTYNVYDYAELSKEAKEKAIEWAQECLREDNFFYDDVKSDWTEKLESFGFTDIDIAYSGFWSQGDGASFTGKCDVVKFIKATKQSKHYAKLLYQAKKGNLDMSGESYRFTHHYSHENTVKGNVEFYYQADPKNDLSNLENELVDSLTEFIRAQSKKIYRELESAYEEYTSKESAIDMIEANEYTFLENGKRSD